MQRFLGSVAVLVLNDDLITNEKFSKGTKTANWKELSDRSVWWPEDVPFGDPNNSKPRLSSDQLHKILASYSMHTSDTTSPKAMNAWT